LCQAVREDRRSEELGIGESLIWRISRRVQVGDGEGRAVGKTGSDDLDDPPLLGPGEPGYEGKRQEPRLRFPEVAAVQDEPVPAEYLGLGPEQNCVRLAGERRAKQAVVKGCDLTPEGDRDWHGPEAGRLSQVGVRLHAAPVGQAAGDPTG